MAYRCGNKPHRDGHVRGRWRARLLGSPGKGGRRANGNYSHGLFGALDIRK